VVGVVLSWLSEIPLLKLLSFLCVLSVSWKLRKIVDFFPDFFSFFVGFIFFYDFFRFVFSFFSVCFFLCFFGRKFISVGCLVVFYVML
jgi:hypothetical protein